MSHLVNDALMDKAVDLAIEELINGTKNLPNGMSPDNPFFDKAVDKLAEKIYEDLTK